MKKSIHAQVFLLVLSAAITTLGIQDASSDVSGKYTTWLHELVSTKNYQKLNPTSDLNDSPKNPVVVNCLETSKQRYYIGVSQTMTVHASLDAVSSVVEDINQYADLFPGFAHVNLVSREGNRLVTAWEQEIPVFFIPNVKYKMNYTLSRPTENTRIYQYQLDAAGTVRESDGFVVLEKISDQATRYTELDFFDANWGALETFAPGRIWKDSIDAAYTQDLAIKLKSETPTLSSKEAREGAEKLLKSLTKAQDEVKGEDHGKSPGELCADHKTVNWSERFPGLLPYVMASPAPSESPKN